MDIDPQQAVTLLLATEADIAGGKAVADKLRDHLYQVAISRYRQDSTVQNWRDPSGMGVVRLDNVGKPPRITVAKPDEWGSYLAERAPDAVRATIEIPAAWMSEALDALAFAGLPAEHVVAKVEAIPARAEDWLSAHARVTFADGDHVVQEVEPGPDGTVTVVTPQIPGLQVTAEKPRLYARLEPAIKARATADALADLPAGGESDDTGDTGHPGGGEDATQDGGGAEPGQPAAPLEQAGVLPVEQAGDVADVASWDVARLRKACSDAGLRTSGNKRDLVERLTDLLDSHASTSPVTGTSPVAP